MGKRLLGPLLFLPFHRLPYPPDPCRRPSRISPPRDKTVPLAVTGLVGVSGERGGVVKRRAASYPLALGMLKAIWIAPVAAERSSALMTAEMEETAQLKARILVSDRSRV